MSKSVWVSLAVSIVGVVIAMAGRAAAEPLQPKRDYVGPVVLEAGGGVSFTLPEGFRGRLDDAEEYFVMERPKIRVVLYAAVRAMTVAETRRTLSRRLPVIHGLAFEPEGLVVQNGRRLRARYRAVGDQSPLVGVVEALIGRNGQGVFVLGASDSARRLVGPLGKFISSVRIAPVKALAAGKAPPPRTLADKKWVFALRGKGFTRGGQQFSLCANGRFEERAKGDSSETAEGSEAQLASSSRGAWSVADGALHFRYDDRSTKEYALAGTPQAIALSGTSVALRAVDCR